jgi:hypothetical protein
MRGNNRSIKRGKRKQWEEREAMRGNSRNIDMLIGNTRRRKR